MVLVFKVGSAAHTNKFGLGDTGRYRTNVWDYPRISSIRAGRTEELAMHPTVKPVALVADAIKDFLVYDSGPNGRDRGRSNPGKPAEVPVVSPSRPNPAPSPP